MVVCDQDFPCSGRYRLQSRLEAWQIVNEGNDLGWIDAWADSRAFRSAFKGIFVVYDYTK